MNLMAVGGLALVVVSGIAAGEGVLLVRWHDALVISKRETQQERSRTDAVQRARGQEHRDAETAYGALQARCEGETQRAADAGRAIERARNATAPPGGRNGLGAGDLRVIGGQPRAAPRVSAEPDSGRPANTGPH